MTDSDHTENQTLEDTPGTLLREARESRGWTVETVADKLNLLRSVVRQIEADEYSKLRGETFARGYVRNYARLMNLPEAAIMELYRLQVSAPEQVRSKSFFGRRSAAVDNAAQGVGRATIAVVLFALTVFMVFENRKPVADTLSPATTEHSVKIDTRSGTRIVPLTPGPAP